MVLDLADHRTAGRAAGAGGVAVEAIGCEQEDAVDLDEHELVTLHRAAAAMDPDVAADSPTEGGLESTSAGRAG